MVERPSEKLAIVQFFTDFIYYFQSVLIMIHTALLVGRSRDRFPVVSLGIFSVAPDGTMCPGVDSASENECQGFLLG